MRCLIGGHHERLARPDPIQSVGIDEVEEGPGGPHEDGSVYLSCQGRGDHVALQGRATVDPDKAPVAGLWNPGAQVFWPEGPQAHDVVALVIDPGHADV